LRLSFPGRDPSALSRGLFFSPDFLPFVEPPGRINRSIRDPGEISKAKNDFRSRKLYLASTMPHRKKEEGFVKCASGKINLSVRAGAGRKKGVLNVTHPFQAERVPLPVTATTRRNELINGEVTFLSLSVT